ncbi:MAG: glycoside hydrolase [Acidimicrobiia bacterium]|nr:glycoside hydrolase [Acidimicrobiia bacterium]
MSSGSRMLGRESGVRRFAAVVAFAALVGACTSSTNGSTTTVSEIAPAPPVTTTTVPGAPDADPGFYLMLMWHQHQPNYPKDEQGVYTRPWVRVHATKDYYDMAAMVEDYPNVNVTFNLTPVLLRQLEDLASGAKDSYWVASEIPAEDLTQDDKLFLLERFYDVNPKIIARFPRYQELAEMRDPGQVGVLIGWTAQDFRDLQVLFNLAWTDPDFLTEEPLASLVAKGSGFTEEDKAVVLGEHLRIIQEIIPLHARLWDEGIIEVTTTPLAHPILPLITNTDLARVGDEAALLPADRFLHGADAGEHVLRGLDDAERLLGRRPEGMWPGEGAVAQTVMNLFGREGVRWVATGEDVLARSLDVSFTRNSEDTVEQGDLLYRPWAAQLDRYDDVAMFFRDVRISDQIGFEYSGTEGDAAADDFMNRLLNIRDSLDVEAAVAAGRPYVVSVILDGENAWENYPNDGKDFLNALYERLNDADWVSTITPSEYLDRFAAPEPLDEVFPAAWFQPNFATWIGEEEEATAWQYLFEVRDDYENALGSGEYGEEALAAAFEAMLFAEGSDWFWWYGADQESGDDGYFDRAYRELLGQVYDALGQPRPDFVRVPIIPENPIVADQGLSDILSITIDGIRDDAWAEAGSYGNTVPGGIKWAIDRENLYVFVGLGPEHPFELYLGTPGPEKAAFTFSGDVLGFGATHVLTRHTGGVCLYAPVPEKPVGDCERLVAAELDEGGVEIAIPLANLGALEAGDNIIAKLWDRVPIPSAGPMAFQVPDISNVSVFLDVEDPLDDDHGPGTYTYPNDPVFIAGSYDFARFQVGTENDQLVLIFEVDAPIQNPWGSPRGLSIQTFDVYIDTDPGSGTGSRLLIPGRNAALDQGEGWEYGITVEGWDPAIYVAAADGTWEETKPSFGITTFGDKGKVVARIPLALFEHADPESWAYSATVMSQEGFPSSGVRRIRDVLGDAEQWRLGGGPADINHTRIIDVVFPIAGEQESSLSAYSGVSEGTIDDLGPDDFGKIPLFVP